MIYLLDWPEAKSMFFQNLDYPKQQTTFPTEVAQLK